MDREDCCESDRGGLWLKPEGIGTTERAAKAESITDQERAMNIESIVNKKRTWFKESTAEVE